MAETAGDLFGLDRALTPQERSRLRGRSPSGRPRTKARGYAALPGTGPADETCGSCANLVRRDLARTYLKCGLMQAHWTGGTGSDVRRRSPVCSRWQRPAWCLLNGVAHDGMPEARR